MGKPQETKISDTGATLPAPVSIAPELNAPRISTQESIWVFNVDSNRTHGKIDLSLDPKGSLLGAKPARDSAPLSGQVIVTVKPRSDGTNSIQFNRVNLTNTAKLLMPFKWSRFLGKINVNIPAGVLKITGHSFPNQTIIGKNGTFSIPRNFFTVGGQARVLGSGLVLGKAVGQRKVNLTIKKTEPVILTGSLITKNGNATLRIPAAVMRDQFDLGNAQLELTFTGDIVARAIIR